MAGGTWNAQNKVRPGAYINFKAVPKPSNHLGSRGVMTMPVPMSWGPQGKLIELLSTDLLDTKSLAKIGYVATDPESLVFRQALRNCYKALVYRLDKLQKSTGLDLRVFEDAITFKIALMVVKYMKYMESLEY